MDARQVDGSKSFCRNIENPAASATKYGKEMRVMIKKLIFILIGMAILLWVSNGELFSKIPEIANTLWRCIENIYASSINNIDEKNKYTEAVINKILP